MKYDSYSELQQENDRLRILATHDELTGILNRRAVEEDIRGAMAEGGALLVCDLDGFKQINDKYGHLAGDNCLRETARLLKFLLRTGDILGRIGGDEFVIFALSCRSEEAVERLRERIEGRFRSYREHENIPLGISVGGTLYAPGDTYETMFGRADADLLRIKDKRHRRPSSNAGTADNWMTDMSEIRQELTEQITQPGASCRDFESFKTIYRFIERCMRRDNRKAGVVLISLVDTGSEGVPFDIRDQMALLGDIIRQSLRMGDVYTRYSSCQYLILLVDVDLALAEAVEQRIENTFHNASPKKSLIFHLCSELQAAILPERAGEPIGMAGR